MRFGAGGSWTLVVRGRSTGAEQHIPVIPADVDGTRRKRATERFRAVEVPVDERGPIIDRYRATAGRTVTTYFKRLPDAADHPTFRLEPL